MPYKQTLNVKLNATGTYTYDNTFITEQNLPYWELIDKKLFQPSSTKRPNFIKFSTAGLINLAEKITNCLGSN